MQNIPVNLLWFIFIAFAEHGILHGKTRFNSITMKKNMHTRNFPLMISGLLLICISCVRQSEDPVSQRLLSTWMRSGNCFLRVIIQARRVSVQIICLGTRIHMAPIYPWPNYISISSMKRPSQGDTSGSLTWKWKGRF